MNIRNRKEASWQGLIKRLRAALVIGLGSGMLAAGCSGGGSKIAPGENAPGNARQGNGTWGMTGYGGGGAMFYPAVSPFDPHYAFVACDMTGSYVTYNGGESWRMFNLRGKSDYFVFDPADSNIVYANGLGLFKSVDKGITWSLIYPSPADVMNIVSKGDHAQELIVTRDSSISKVSALAADPQISGNLFAAISVNHLMSLYTSKDGGQQWKKEKDLNDEVKNIFIVPSSPASDRTIYIVGKNSVTVREHGKYTVNKGPAGVKMLTTVTGGFDREKNKFVLYAISGKSYFNPEGDPSGIYYSDDAGKTWQNRQEGLLSYRGNTADLPEWRTVATSAGHPETVYVSYNHLKANGDTAYIGVAKSQDYGKSWTLSWKDVLSKKSRTPSENFRSGWINPRFGPGWGENPFSIGVSPSDPGIVYATDFGRTVKTVNGGKTWEQAYTNKNPGGGWSSRGLDVTTGYAIVTDPFDSMHLFICNTDVGLMESTDGGESWLSATQDNGIPRKWQNSTYWMVFDPEVKGKIWAVMSGIHDLPRPKMWRKNSVSDYGGGVVVSADGGKSWKTTSENIGEAALTHILLDPSSDKNSRTLYACGFGKGVYKSTDGGKTWAQKNAGLPGKEPFAWRITRRAMDGVLFLIVSRRSDDGSIGNAFDGAVYRSDDGAESWKPLVLPEGTNGPTSIETDDKDTSRLLLSAWGRFVKEKISPDTGGGIFLSENGGKTWASVLHKDQHIHDITFDARNNTYYACGFNGSAYRSEDRGATWKRIRGYNFKWGKRVDPDPRDPEKIYVITFGGGVWHGPARGDENSIEDIITKFETR